jgi:hypothetical protein
VSIASEATAKAATPAKNDESLAHFGENAYAVVPSKDRQNGTEREEEAGPITNSNAPTKLISNVTSATAVQILQLQEDVIESPVEVVGTLSSSSNHTVSESLKRSKKRGIKI